MSSGIRNDDKRSIMNRIRGIHVLALGVAVWGLAVWLLGSPHPDETEPAAETASGEAPPAAGHAAVSSTPAGTPSTSTRAGSPAPPSDPGVRSASTAVAPAPAGEGVPAVPSSAGAPSSTPAAGAPQLATAPAQPGTGVAAAPTGVLHGPRGDDTVSGPAPGGSVAPRYSGAGSTQGIALPPGLPPPPAQPFGQLEYPMPPSLPPARSGAPASGASVVASELASARRAAWEGRLANALAHYRAAARIQPDSHVVWGEMGNVLWAMRRWPEAAYALEGAATLLVTAGELHAASTLVPAVGMIDPDAAQRVQQRMWAVARREPG